MTAGRRPSAADYVQEGLVLYLDGIEQGGTAGVWTDLVGGHVFSPSGGVAFNADHIALDGTGSLTNSTFTCPGHSTGTIETVVADNAPEEAAFVFSPKSGGTRLMIHISGYRIRGKAGSNSGPKYVLPVDTASISLTGTVCYVNGVAATQDGTGNMNGGSSNCVGARGSSSKFKGKIYCVRIYNRKLTEEEVLANLAVDRARFGIG